MQKKLVLLFVTSLLLSAAELAYVETTPLLGEADPGELILGPVTASALNFTSGEPMGRTNIAYTEFYGKRPHAAEAYSVDYKLDSVGLYVMDSMDMGLALWRLGIFTIDLGNYPEQLTGLSDSYFFSFSEIETDAGQQEALLKKLHEINDSIPLSPDGLVFLASEDNLSISENGEKIAIIIDDYGVCRFYAGTIGFDEGTIDHPLGQVITEDGKKNVYSDYYGKVISAYGPRAVGSDYLTDMPVVGTASVTGILNGTTYLPGRTISSIPLGWFSLQDAIGCGSFVLFDESFGRHMNLSHERFLGAYSTMFYVFFARMSFVESVLDERPPWSGIYYLAYYPKYGKVWLTMKGVGAEELHRSRVLIDGKESKREVSPPFVFIDAQLNGGRHSLKIEMPDASYSKEFDVDLTAVEIVAPSLSAKGRDVNFSLVGIGGKDDQIRVKDVNISWRYEESWTRLGRGITAERVVNFSKSGEATKEIGKDLEQYSFLSVSFSIPVEMKRGEDFTADGVIDYMQNGTIKQHKFRIETYAE